MIKKLYPEFKRRAFTTSYDDGIVQDKRLVEVFRKYHILGTFNLCSGQSGSPKMRGDIDCGHLDIPSSYHIYDGFEIATHTVSHPHLEDIYDQEIQDAEYIDDIRTLSDWTKRRIYGSAYPFGTYNHLTFNALKKAGIVYARTVKSTYDFRCPVDFLLWHPTIHHNDPRLIPLLEEFFLTNEELPLFFMWGHGYEFAINDNFSLLDVVFSMLNSKDDIYYCTNYDLYLYLNAINKLLVKNGLVINNSDQTVYLEIDGKNVALHPFQRFEVCE